MRQPDQPRLDPGERKDMPAEDVQIDSVGPREDGWKGLGFRLDPNRTYLARASADQTSRVAVAIQPSAVFSTRSPCAVAALTSDSRA